MRPITRQACDHWRKTLGLHVPPEEIAARVGGKVSTVLARYTRPERRVWRATIRAKAVAAERAEVVRQLRSRMLREGRVLTFAESGLDMDTVRRVGGYHRLVREAGATPIRVGRPSPTKPRPVGRVGGLTTARHWQQGAR